MWGGEVIRDVFNLKQETLTMPRNPILTRRQLVGNAAAFAIPTIVPSGVIGMRGRQGANDRIVTAVIGTGGMGSSHVRPDTAALCDVDDAHLAAAAARVTKAVPMLYKDFRRVLDRKDIDAVFIGAPDHWHAIMAVMAVQSGKHVYSEKPTARTIEEGRAMLNAARYHNRVMQIGAQGRSNPSAAAAARYIRNGGIGAIERVDIWHPVNFSTNDFGLPQAPSSSLDWNMWLGPARWIDYHPLRCHFNFRWFMDFGAGFIRDRGNHALNVVAWCTDLDSYNGIVTCEASSTPHLTGCFDSPAAMEVTWKFQNPTWTLTWSQPGKANARFPGEWGATYKGKSDDLVVLGGDGGCSTEPKAMEYKSSSSGFEPYMHPVDADPTERHRLNFLDCCKTGKLPATDIAIGHKVIQLCILGNIANVLGRKVTYDLAKEEFIGDEAANRMRGDSYRSPWKL